MGFGKQLKKRGKLYHVFKRKLTKEFHIKNTDNKLNNSIEKYFRFNKTVHAAQETLKTNTSENKFHEKVIEENKSDIKLLEFCISEGLNHICSLNI